MIAQLAGLTQCSRLCCALQCVCRSCMCEPSTSWLLSYQWCVHVCAPAWVLARVHAYVCACICVCLDRWLYYNAAMQLRYWQTCNAAMQPR